MGRLIDADVLMEYFKRLSDECSSENDYEYSNLYDCVCAKIMTQPTAYSVENVVSELEKQAEQYNRRARELVDKSTEAGIHNKGKACSYEHAIDIVKRGGVDGKE